MDTSDPPPRRLEKRPRDPHSAPADNTRSKKIKNIETDGYVKPRKKKTTKWTRAFQKRPNTTTPTNNRFEVLRSTEEENASQSLPQDIPLPTDQSTDEEPSTSRTLKPTQKVNKNTNITQANKNKNQGTSQNKQTTPKKGEKPPPIVFDGVLKDRREIIPLIKSLTTKPFYFKYGGDSALLYTETVQDFENVKQKLKEDEVSFYSYSLKKDKTHAFVLRGLDFEPEPSEIMQEMKDDYNIMVKEVYRLNTSSVNISSSNNRKQATPCVAIIQ
ncbi:unnamed protein product [Phaedon cochleariae]|uniref:Uncharacterized protein n=1 Tax=Phaedon cochleariae TaxID=80249 RepID=A0A9N9X216_PHACE|nr:unnamed protein product [Phaedon cochleariae]